MSPLPALALNSEIMFGKIIVELRIIELGRLFLHEMKECYFTLINTSDLTVEFTVSKTSNQGALFRNFNITDSLEPHETRRVYLILQPIELGRQIGSFRIKNDASGEECDVSFKWYAINSSYLRFNDDPTADTLEIDLGFSYVDPLKRFSQVTRLLVENISDDDLYIQPTSNLALQCFMFADEALESPLGSFNLERYSKIVIFFALQPYISSNQPTTLKPLINSILDCRNLVGGIKFLISKRETNLDLPPVISESTLIEHFQLMFQMVKFSSFIGQSMMSISHSIIDFGVSNVLDQPMESGFFIENLSPKMPLDYQILCSDSKLVSISAVSGVIPGSVDENSKIWITVKLIPFNYGLLSCQITVLNKNNSKQILTINVSVFVCGNQLGLAGDCLKYLLDQSPSISWENLYVEITESSCALVNKSRISERSFKVQNKSGEDLTFAIQSDMNVSVRWQISVSSGSLTDAFPDYIGPSVVLNAGGSGVVFISAPKPNLSSDDISLLNSGKKVSSNGSMLFKNSDGVAIGFIRLKCFYCLSVAEIDMINIDLGKVGHINGWKDSMFSFNVLNLSDITLNYNIECPDSIEIKSVGSEIDKSAIKRKIEPGSSNLITACFNPRQISNYASGIHQFEIKVVNIYNPSNTRILTLSIFLTVSEIKFERLEDGELVIPSVCHPSILGNTGSDTWFVILNNSDDELKFEISVNLTPDVSDLIRMSVLSRFSNTPLVGTISLAPHANTEVRVRTFPKDNRLPVHSPSSKYLLNPSGITFGTLTVTPKKQNKEFDKLISVENIPVRGVIMEVPLFSIDTVKINLCSLADSFNSNSQRGLFTITNLASAFDLEFQIFIDLGEFMSGVDLISITPLEENLKGIVPAGTSLVLFVELLNQNIKGVSEDIKIIITDVGSVSRHSHTIMLNIIDEDDSINFKQRQITEEPFEASIIRQHLSSNNIQDLFEESDLVSVVSRSDQKSLDLNRSLFLLKGCKKLSNTDIGGLFELDLGQQDLANTPLIRKIVLESIDRVSYTISTVSNLDKLWIIPNRYDGTLDSKAGLKESHTITISFMTSARGLYSTYVIIENLENPLDTKTVRVSLEVVAKQNVRRLGSTNILSSTDSSSNHVFDVYLSGVDASLANFELNQVFFNSEFAARSFLVCNRELVPIVLTVKYKIKGDDNSELLFSLSKTSSKLFKSLSIEPESQVRIYLHFTPICFDIEIMTLKESEEKLVEKQIEVSVNCRLVKDYQKIIPIRAVCRYPQIKVFPNEIIFSACFNESGAQFNTLVQYVSVENLFGEDILELEILNDSLYFSVDIEDGNVAEVKSLPLWNLNNDKNWGSKGVYQINPKSRVTVRIRVLIDVIAKNIEKIKKEKYFIEHFTIYNKKRPLEHHFIQLKLSFGQSRHFQFASCSRSSFIGLEQNTVKLLREFDYFHGFFQGVFDLQVENELYFRFVYISDQLVYYGTREHSGDNYLLLAKLMFGYFLVT